MRPFVPLTFLFVFVFLISELTAQQASAGYECKVNIDLVNVSREKDRVHITIVPPPIRSRHVRYVLPEYIAGVGGKVDAGQFLHEFYALDDQGMPVKAVKRHGGNVVLLKLRKGRTLRKLDYWVDDTFDKCETGDYHNDKYNYVSNAYGTNFEGGKQYLLNAQFMYGYFEGYSWIPYRVSVTHDNSLFAFTGLKSVNQMQSRDEFTANSYTEALEFPIYYGTPDTCGFASDNIYVDVAVYSETGTITARQIRRYIGAEVAATTKFLGDIPPRHYKMLFYLVSPKDFRAGTKGVFGGVARRNSAVYYLLESPDEDQMVNTVVRESAGDLLKMIPLLDGSQQLISGDFLKPQITKSWWISEGMKSYFKWQAEIRDSVVSEEEFMAAISAKICLYDKVKTRPLEQPDVMAKAMHDPLVAEEYKAKAMLAAFMLDIQVTQMSGGEKDLRDIVMGLSDSASFSVDSLERYICKIISPDLRTFFLSFIHGVKPLPLIESCDKIGWVYSPFALDSMLTFGQVSLYYDENADAFFVRQADPDNALTLQAGDRLVSIDGIHVDAANLDAALASIYSPQSDDAVEVIFIRGIQNERVMAAPFYHIVVIDHPVRPDQACSTDALLLHNRIFSME